MGLDMYLSASKYAGGWEHSKEESKELFNKLADTLGVKDVICESSPAITVDFTVMYWRKANQIHNWFVNTVQDGEDNCARYYVSRENLKQLVELCKQVLNYQDRGDADKMAQSALPPSAGFFFGSTSVDDWYWEDVKKTATELQQILDNPKLNGYEFYYQSSW